MDLPYMMTAAKKSQKQIITFGGVNYSAGATDGELLESCGLSSARFPTLSQRMGRKTYAEYEKPTALFAADKLCVVDGTALLYDGETVGQVTEGEKNFAAINTKIVIMPDKVYFDTEEKKLVPMEAQYLAYAGTLSFSSSAFSVPTEGYFLSSAEEESVKEGVPSATTITAYALASVDGATGALTMSEGVEKDVSDLEDGDLIQYECDTAKEYMEVKSVTEQTEEDGAITYTVTYILHTSTAHTYQDFDQVFSVGDAIEISGCTSFPDNNGTYVIRSMSGRKITFTGDIFQETGTEAGTVLLKRKVPDFTCMCESDNRIWGAEGSTIYASALGDPTNFFVYDGLSTDSYAVAVGTEGDFTGCVAYGSSVLFWKENYMHKVLGTLPANYELYTYTVPGIQKNSEKSLVVINEVLYYKGRNGVYAYTGGTPELISKNFGTRRWTDAVAGSDGENYYISMKTESGVWELYVYDTLRGIWLRQDTIHVMDFALLDGQLYYMDGDNNRLMLTGQDYSEEGRIEWSATLCRIDETVLNRKGYSRLILRADLEAGSWIKVEVSPDGAPFRQVFSTHNELAKTAVIPLRPVRCDSFRIRLSGKGVCMLRSIVREFSIGSEYGKAVR